MNKLIGFGLAALSAACISACGGGGSAPGPLPAVTTQSTVPALVATPVIYAALGDSITLGGEASTPANDYVSLVGAALGAQTTNLGIGGETEAPVNVMLGGLNVVYPGVSVEVPQIPANANLVTLFIGTNDLWISDALVDAGAPVSTIPTMVQNYVSSLSATVSAIRARVPAARLFVMTVPDPNVRYAQGEPAAIQAALLAADDTMRAGIMASGATVVDLQCDASLYAAANYANPWDVHPNNAGHAIIAADILAALRGAQPMTTCAYQ